MLTHLVPTVAPIFQAAPRGWPCRTLMGGGARECGSTSPSHRAATERLGISLDMVAHDPDIAQGIVLLKA